MTRRVRKFQRPSAAAGKAPGPWYDVLLVAWCLFAISTVAVVAGTAIWHRLFAPPPAPVRCMPIESGPRIELEWDLDDTLEPMPDDWDRRSQGWM